MCVISKRANFSFRLVLIFLPFSIEKRYYTNNFCLTGREQKLAMNMTSSFSAREYFDIDKNSLKKKQLVTRERNKKSYLKPKG